MSESTVGAAALRGHRIPDRFLSDRAEEVSLLVIEADPSRRERLAGHFQDSDPSFRLVFAETGREALTVLASACVDCVLLEDELSDGDASEFLEQAQYHLLTTPVIIYSDRFEAVADVRHQNACYSVFMSKDEVLHGQSLSTTVVDICRKARVRSGIERIGSTPALLQRAGALLIEHEADSVDSIASLELHRRLIFETAVQVGSEGIVLLEDRSRILFANVAFRKMLGLSSVESLPGHPQPTIEDVLTAESLGTVRKRKEQGGEKYEVVLQSLRGVEVPVLVAETVIRPNVMLWTLTDLRELKEKERRLREACRLLEEKNHRLAELYDTAQHFLDHVSHEFRAPLAVMRENALIVRDGLLGTVNAEQRASVDAIAHRVDELAFMVSDMLDSSRLDAGLLSVARKPCQLVDVVDNVRAILLREAEAARVWLEIELDDGLPDLFCDPERIGRVLINLGVNAVKFTPEGGAVRIWASVDQGASRVCCGVTDNGPGIGDEHLETIFERFTQLEPRHQARVQGFGLGLYIARELVHLNFGEIRVESQLGKGTTFEFTVPVANPLTITESYLNWLNRKWAGDAYVSFGQVEFDGNVEPGLADGIDALLRSVVRQNDVVLRAQANRWLIALGSRAEDASKSFERVRKACVDWTCKTWKMVPPQLRWKLDGTLALSSGRSAIIAGVRSAVGDAGR